MKCDKKALVCSMIWVLSHLYTKQYLLSMEKLMFNSNTFVVSSIMNRVNCSHHTRVQIYIYISSYSPQYSCCNIKGFFFFTLRIFHWVYETFSMKCSLSLFNYRQHYLKIYSFICCKIFETVPFGLKPIGSSSKTPPYHHHHPSPTWAY